MAYTASPENNTYKTVELDFTASTWLRSDSSVIGRDPEIFNMLYDRVSNENQTRDFVLKKRAGLSATGINLNKDSSGDIINGFFQDTNTGYIYWSVNNKVWRYAGSNTTLIGTMGGTTPTEPNTVGFCLFLKSTGVRYLMISNGSELWYHDTAGIGMTEVTDADLPSPMIPHMVFLDGYLFLIKSGTGDIYNSDLDDPTAWTPGNYVTAEISPDLLINIAKVKNYLIAFGTDGVEFFYDAANASGSPLGRNESYYKRVILSSSIANYNDQLYFVGRQQNGQAQVYVLDGNSLKEISVPWVNRYLQNQIAGSSGSTTVTQLNRVYYFTCNGHNFILITFANNSSILVYDIDENFWYRWSLGSAFNNISNSVYGACVSVTGLGVSYLILGGQPNLSQLSETTYQDFTTNFTASYITEDVTENTFNWKSCHRVGLHCDYPTTSATSYAQISWSDDDGQTWATERDLMVTTNNPYITQLGRFRTRNWRITYSDNYPFRMWGLSMDLNVGTI